MSGLVLTLLAVCAGVLAIARRRQRTPADDEPWRASLEEEDDEPLDMEEIRRAEEEWAGEPGFDDEEEEPWS